MIRRALLFPALIALAACQGVENPTQPNNAALSPPSLVISDATHGSGNEDFFFLPPMVADPSGSSHFDAGAFNPNVDPTVKICALNATTDGGVTAGTLCKTGSGAYSLTVVLTAPTPGKEQYLYEWKVPSSNADNYYRAEVFLGTTRLGYADIKTGSVPSNQLANLVEAKDGKTVPVKFRIENAALCKVVGTATCSSESVNVATGGDVRTQTPAGEAGVIIPPQGSGGTTVITVDGCTLTNPGFTDMNPAVTDIPTFGPCVTVNANPPLSAVVSGGVLQNAATVFICDITPLLPAGMSHEQTERITLHRHDPGPVVAALPHAPHACAPIITSAGSVKGFFASLMRGSIREAGRNLATLFTPRVLHAAVLDVGGGGFTDFFSAFQFALPVKMAKVASTDNQIAPPGPLPTNPEVLVTDLGDDPVEGARVRFGGTTESACLAVPVSSGVLTAADGSASSPWTITAGANTLVACGRGIADADEATNGPRTGAGAFDPFQPIQSHFDGADPVGGPVDEPVLNGSVTFTATGVVVNPIRISGFDSPRNREPLTGAGSSSLYTALNNSANFGATGVVSCSVAFSPFVQTVATGSLVSGGNRLVDVFFAGLTATDLTTGEAAELAAFVNAGGILYIGGNSGTNEGPSYHPLFAALGATTAFNASPEGSNFVETSDPPDNTPFTNGPFGTVGPLQASIFRGIQPGTMTGMATGFGSTEYLLVEGAFGSGRLSATGDPIHLDLFSSDADNQKYFLNLFAAGCSPPPPSLTRLRGQGR